MLRHSAIVLACVVTPFEAQAAPPNTITCSQNQPIFRLELVQRGRYVPATTLFLAADDDDLARPFQDPGEEALRMFKTSIALELNPGSCTINPLDRGHLIECKQAKNDAVQVKYPRLLFSYGNRSASGAPQEVAVSRTLSFTQATVHAAIEHRQATLGMQDRVIAQITVEALVGGKPRRLSLTRDLGEWTDAKNRSSYDRCVIGVD
jgi:hypothetical protein